MKYYLVGGFNPSEKYESQLGWLLPIYGKIKNVPNHQPAMDMSAIKQSCWSYNFADDLPKQNITKGLNVGRANNEALDAHSCLKGCIPTWGMCEHRQVIWEMQQSRVNKYVWNKTHIWFQTMNTSAFTTNRTRYSIESRNPDTSIHHFVVHSHKDIYPPTSHLIPVGGFSPHAKCQATEGRHEIRILGKFETFWNHLSVVD